MKKIEPSEHDIQTLILNYLPYFGVKALRINSGMIRATNKYGKNHMIRMAPVGTPDIIGCHKSGRMVCIEVKKPSTKNNVTTWQQNSLDEWRDAGALSFVATSIEDVEKELKKLTTKLIDD